MISFNIDKIRLMTEESEDSNIRLCYYLNKASQQKCRFYYNDKFYIIHNYGDNKWFYVKTYYKDEFITTVLNLFPKIKYYVICFLNDELQKHNISIKYDSSRMNYIIMHTNGPMYTNVDFDQLEKYIKLSFKQLEYYEPI